MIDDHNPKFERTLVIIKPDAVARALTGEILARFEKRGLKLVGIKMVKPTPEHLDQHYSGGEEWLKMLGQKTYDGFAEFGWDVKERMGTDDKLEIGKMVKQWLIDYMLEGPLVAMILEGIHAVSTVRKMVGHTVPIQAESGTIRGDLSMDANTIANMEKRSLRNIIHASGSVDEAKFEIEHWFSPEEIHDYQRADEHVMLGS